MIKSNNPHLAGGEYIYMLYVCYESLPCIYIYTYLLRINIMYGKIWVAVYK